MAKVIHSAGWDRKEENYQEYLRLLNDPDYYDVTFDEESGGVSAVHVRHRFDKQHGNEGAPRGIYERIVIDTFRHYGHLMVLLNESSDVGIKQYDGLLDGIPCEIKAVEHIGRWTIRTKIGNAIKQRAEIIVLFFPNSSIFSKERVKDGWNDYLAYTKPSETGVDIKILCVIDYEILLIEKPSW